jgi:hypothetical protein
MRFAPLSFLLFFCGCSNDGFAGMDGGDADMSDTPVGMIEGGLPDAPADTYMPPAIHRVFVANQNTNNGAKPVVAWDNADKLSVDRAPDVEIVGGMTTTSRLALAKDRLYGWDDTSLVLTGFDNAGTITSSSIPAVGLGQAQFLGTGTAALTGLFYSPEKDVLITSCNYPNGNAVQMFTAASTLLAGTKAKAQFGPTNAPFASTTLDMNDQLYLYDSTQSIIRYVSMASTRTGAVSITMDFAGPQMEVRAMVTDASRLYAAGAVLNAAPSVFIYNLANIHPGSMPDVTLNASSGLPAANGVCNTITLANDVLSVACNSMVYSFSGAKTVTNSSQATLLTSDTTLVYRVLSSPKTGLLYTAGRYKGNNGLQVWKSPASSPTLQAEMKTGIGPAPQDIALYEP